MCLCVCVSAGERVRGHRRGPVAARGCGATQFLDSKKGMLGAQQLVTRKGNDSYCVNLLSGFDLSTTQGQRGTTSLHSSSGGPAVAFLAAIPGGCMTLGKERFAVCVVPPTASMLAHFRLPAWSSVHA